MTAGERSAPRPEAGRDSDDEAVWRRAAPHVLAALVHRFGGFADCEDALQEAAEAALSQWPTQGLPADPPAWLFRVASRRMIEQIRRDTSRRRREERLAALEPATDTPSAADELVRTSDADLLHLMMLCCHDSLSRTSQVALMLRAVTGLTTRQIARGFMVPEATMGQRISRAKSTLTRAGARFEPPSAAQLPERALAVRHAIAVLYTQGHVPVAEDHRADQVLRESGIDLARRLHRAVPGDPENSGLLALLLLSEARALTRVDDTGCLVPLESQDRRRWDQELVAEGIDLIERALPHGYVGTFQLQASIAAVHAEARAHASTDWAQILVLYDMLGQVDPSFATTIGRAAAVAEVHGARAGLEALAGVDEAPHARVHAVRGHLLARLGRHDEARAEFAAAARLTTSVAEQRYLNSLLDGRRHQP